MWLYTNDLTVNRGGEDKACNKTQLIGLYLFGQKYEMPKLCNRVVDQIIPRFENYWILISGPRVSRVYVNTLPGAPLCRVIVATYVQSCSSLMKVYEKYRNHYLASPEFLFDVVTAIASCGGKPSNSGTILDPCQYYQHAEVGERCLRPAVQLTPPDMGRVSGKALLLGKR